MSARAAQDVPADRGPLQASAVPYRVTAVLAVLTCALAPAYVVRWHIGFYPTTLLEAAIVVTLVSYAVETVLSRQPIRWRSPFVLFGTLLLVAGAISVVVAPDRRAALGLYRAYFIEPMLFFLALVNIIRSSAHAVAVVAGLGAGGAVVALLNIATVLEALRHHAVDTSQNAPVALYQTSNAVALFLVPIIAVAGALMLHGPSARERRISAAFIALAGSAVVLSFSRGGYLAMVVVAIGLALSHRYRWWLIGAIVLVGVVATRVPILASRLGHEINFSDPNNTLSGRFHLWQVTLTMMKARPIFGSGLSGYAHDMSPWPNGLIQVIYPHNLILNFWVSTGVLGVIAFLGLFVRAFQTAWAGWRRLAATWRALELGVLVALVSMVVHGLVDVPYFKNDLSFEFWVLLGISWAGLLLARSRSPMPTA